MMEPRLRIRPMIRCIVRLFVSLSLPVISAQNWNQGYQNPYNNYRTPDSSYYPNLQQNPQQNSPFSYLEYQPNSRQLQDSGSPASMFNGGNQFANQQNVQFAAARPNGQFQSNQPNGQLPIPNPGPNAGPSNFPNLPTADLPAPPQDMQFNAPNLPNFKEPEFNFDGLENQNGLGGMNLEGFRGNGWPTRGNGANGPVGTGQLAVPGLPANNPLQQLALGSQLDDQLSAAPLDSRNSILQNGGQSFRPRQPEPEAAHNRRFNGQAQTFNHKNNQQGFVSFNNNQPAVAATDSTEVPEVNNQTWVLPEENRVNSGESDTTTPDSAESEVPNESSSGQLLSQTQQLRSPTGQQIIATVKEVPLDMHRNKIPESEKSSGTDQVIAREDAAEGMQQVDGPHGCGAGGLDRWQKSPCETCTCLKGVTKCEKVKCTERPENPSCIPVYHFTTCCPTFQCPNNSRGSLPTLPAVEPTVQEGDDCAAVGEFVPTSVATPCLACKCNSKLKIQCKTISCLQRPRDPNCREKQPKNPTVCCPEFDCRRPHTKSAVTTTTAPDLAEEDSDETDPSSDEETVGTSAFGNSGAVLKANNDTNTAAGREEPIVVTFEDQTTEAPRITQTVPTRRSRHTTTAATTTTLESTTDASDSEDTEDETTTWPPFRPVGAAVHGDDEADTPRNQEIRSHIAGAAENSVTDRLTKATTSTTSTSQTTKITTRPTITTTTTRRPTFRWSRPVTTQTSTSSDSVKLAPAQDSTEKGVVRDCQGGWKFPAGCDVNRDCTYIARWKQNPMDQTVRYKITTREADKWTGIGFSLRKTLDNVDMVVGWVDKNQKIIIQDRHGDARHPILDQQQTISNLRGVRNGDVTTIEFSRPQRNGDSQDVMTDDVTCPYFVFPVKGGAYDTFTMKIQPHVEEPEISDVGVCITQCKGNAAALPTPFISSTTRSTSNTRSSTAATTTADEDYENTDDTTPASSRKTAAVSGNAGGRCATEGAVMSLNPCQNCSCHSGVIQCINIKCRETYLQNLGCTPLFKIGVCCPEWHCPTTTTRASSKTTAQRPSTQLAAETTVNPVIVVPQNPDKLIILSKKEFAGRDDSDAESNAELDQLVPDRMGVITPPPGWNQKFSGVVPIGNVSTASVTVVLVDDHVKLQSRGCLNFSCGSFAVCVLDNKGSPGCVCKPGYEGNARIACVKGAQKSSADSCSSIKCGKNAECFTIDGQPQCKCQSGFIGDPSVSCDEQSLGGFVQPAECLLRSEIGGCQNFGMRWQYDPRISGCRQFVYSGCAGNDNNFQSRQQCEQRCAAQKRLFRDQECGPDDDIDTPVCSRCECTDQGFVACIPISCGAPPNKDCKPTYKINECCPQYDCSQGNASFDSSVMTASRSSSCRGVTCKEPVFKPGCTRVTMPGECCPTLQCSAVTPATVPPPAEDNANATKLIRPTQSPRPGMSCTMDEKISTSNPCLVCKCINGATSCAQIMCPPITPEQRRKCRITQLPNQCCLSVECPKVTAAPILFRTTVAQDEDNASEEEVRTVRATMSTHGLPTEATTVRSSSVTSARPSVVSSTPTSSTTAEPELTTTDTDAEASETGAPVDKPAILQIIQVPPSRSTTTTTRSSTLTTTITTIKQTPPSKTSTTPSPSTKTSTASISTTAKTAQPVAGKPGCSETSDPGVCHAEITRWFLNPATGKCETFIYTGCGGNKNRYLTEDRCKAACK